MYLKKPLSSDSGLNHTANPGTAYVPIYFLL